MKSNLVDIIKSNSFAGWIALISMFVQAKHTFEAYLSAEAINPNYVDIFFALLAAGIVDLAVLFYTLRNKKEIAFGAAVIMILINGYAYWLEHSGPTPAFFAGIGFSMTIPASVYFYSEEIVTRRRRKSNELEQ